MKPSSDRIRYSGPLRSPHKATTNQFSYAISTKTKDELPLQKSTVAQQAKCELSGNISIQVIVYSNYDIAIEFSSRMTSQPFLNPALARQMITDRRLDKAVGPKTNE